MDLSVVIWVSCVLSLPQDLPAADKWVGSDMEGSDFFYVENVDPWWSISISPVSTTEKMPSEEAKNLAPNAQFGYELHMEAYDPKPIKKVEKNFYKTLEVIGTRCDGAGAVDWAVGTTAP